MTDVFPAALFDRRRTMWIDVRRELRDRARIEFQHEAKVRLDHDPVATFEQKAETLLAQADAHRELSSSPGHDRRT